MFGRGLKTLSLLTVVLIVGAFALVFFYAPNDADQGFIQKIFYLHVPLAIVALFGFVAGGVYGIRYLRSRRPAARPALLRRDPPVADPRGRRAGDRLDLGQGLVGRVVDVGRADARELPDRLPALRLLPAAALLDRGPGAPGALRRGLRDRRGRVRAAELHGRADGAVARAPARALDHRRLDARLDAADVPGLADRHGAAVRDAVEVRAGVQAAPRSGCARSSASSPATTRSGPPTRAAPRRRTL